MFVTMVLAVLDPEAGTLMISSAGHPPPLVRDAEGGVVERGAADGPPLGLDETPRLEHQRYRLARGDVVVLYTDGVTEAENRRGTMFGDDRLRQAVGRGRGTVGVRDEVLSAVKEFAGDAPQSDDVTLVCFGPRAG